MHLYADIADYTWLTTPEAGAILDELADATVPLHTLVDRLRGRVSSSQTHLLLEQVELRRRAAEKFTQPHRMFFTRIGLEQATDEWIAHYKSHRFIPQRAGLSLSNAPVPPAPVKTADLCCGIGGDLMALTKISSAIGIDRDPATAHFAAANTGANVQTTDVTEFDLAAVDAWHIDPDRRATGRRTTSLEYCEPNLPTLERLLAQVPHAAIKLAPATKAPADWSARCELEWISRDRECRQLVAWHGDLALTPAHHRATILNSPPRYTGEGLGEGYPRTIAGSPDHPTPITSTPADYVFDIDPAVLAARLQGTLAAEHNLQSLAQKRTYLTGPSAIVDAALSCFKVDDVLPLRTRTLAQHLQARQIGQLEIKKRGVDIDPEQLRRQLKLRGNNSATLLITNVAARPTAILAHRHT